MTDLKLYAELVDRLLSADDGRGEVRKRMQALGLPYSQDPVSRAEAVLSALCEAPSRQARPKRQRQKRGAR